jgi:pyrroline-5-carboxylate reductase
MKIGIIGAGNLGAAIARGIISNDDFEKLIISKRNISSIKDLKSEKVEVTMDNEHLLKHADILILALKPYNIIPFLREFESKLDKNRHSIVSAATGITIDEIKEVVGEFDIHRAMPNTAATIGDSITALCGNNVLQERKEEVEHIFMSVGETVQIEEHLMESATILGACGVAYVLRFMRAMIQGGIEVGFDAPTATKIVAQTMKGASELIIKNGTHPEEEIDKVTTPKGCTIVGLNEMEHAGFSSALIKGIVTSYQRIEK